MKKSLILMAFLLLLSNAAKAQWTVEAQVGTNMGMSWRHWSGLESSTILIDATQTKPAMGYQLGLQTAYRFSPKWRVVSGLQLEQHGAALRQQTHVKRMYDAYLGIPLLFRHNFSERWGISLGGQYNFRVRSTRLSPTEGWISASEPFSPGGIPASTFRRDQVLDARLGLHYEWQRFSLNASYVFFLNSYMNDSPSSRHDRWHSVQFTVGYRFLK